MQTEMKNIWQVLVKEDSDSEYYDYEKSYLVIGTEAQIKKHLVKEYNEFVDLFFDDQYKTTENQIKKIFCRHDYDGIESTISLHLDLNLGLVDKGYGDAYLTVSASPYDSQAIYNINDDGILITQNGDLLK